MKRDLTIYLAILVVAVVIQYVIELRWGASLGLYARPLVPWMIHAILYGVLGAMVGLSLRSRSVRLRILFASLIPVVAHAIFELTHGSDPAYPYIGLLLIVPDLVAAGVGAGLATVIVSRMVRPKASNHG